MFKITPLFKFSYFKLKNKLITFGRKKLKLLDEHTLEVVQKSSASTVVKVAGMAIGLLVSVLLGRTIGAEGLGIINLSNRIVNILLVVGLLGIRQVIIKEVAIAHNKKSYVHIGDVMYTAYWLNGGISLVLSVIMILLTPWFANSVFKEPRLEFPLMIALLVMTPQVFSRIFSSGMVGYRKIWQSNLVEQTLSIAITGILVVILWLLKKTITVNVVAICYAIGRVGVTLSVGLYWKSLFKKISPAKLITRKLLKTSLPFFVITLSGIIMTNADVIILGFFSNSNEIGLYVVAARIALLTSFFLQVTNTSIAPKVAALFESGKTQELEKMIKQVTKGLGVIGLFILILFIVFGRFILSIWGKEFESAYSVLIVLGIGHFVNISTGAVGVVLTMTNKEVLLKNITLIFTLMYMTVNVFLTYYFGAIGTATATTTTLVFFNFIKVIQANKIIKFI